MKWSDLSLRRQIVLVGAALCLVLILAFFANFWFQLRMSQRSWSYLSRQAWEQGARMLEARFALWNQAADFASGQEAFLADSEETESGVKEAVLTLCPEILQVRVSKVGNQNVPNQGEGFSGLNHFENYLLGITYTLWRSGSEVTTRVQLDIASDQLSQLLLHEEYVNYLITDSKGVVIASTGYSGVNSVVNFHEEGTVQYRNSQGNMYCVTTGALGNTGYQLVTMTFVADRRDYYLYTLPMLIGTFAVLAALTVLGLSCIDRTAVLPLRDMLEIISIMRKRPEAGLSMRLRGNREMQEISGNFNRMMTQNEQLNQKLVEANVRLYKSELIKRKTDLAILVSQVNPHFLYNTLEMIKGMAYRAGSRQIVDMTNALGKVFRFCLKAPDRVTLRQEMEMLKDYLTIQQARFGDRFSVNIRVPEELLEREMLKMTLQPICENAITHGLEMIESGGILTIEAHEDAQYFTVTVTDNGEGIPKEKLEEIRKKMQRISDVAALYELGTENIGMVNVHGRIRLRYGEGYGLTVESQEGVGTSVVLRLPGRRPQVV